MIIIEKSIIGENKTTVNGNDTAYRKRENRSLRLLQYSDA